MYVGRGARCGSTRVGGDGWEMGDVVSLFLCL
jgi:hypothetical protein